MRHNWYETVISQSQRSDSQQEFTANDRGRDNGEHSGNDLTSAGRLPDRHLPTQGTVYCSCSVASDPVLGSAMVVTSFCVHPSAASTACHVGTARRCQPA